MSTELIDIFIVNEEKMKNAINNFDSTKMDYSTLLFVAINNMFSERGTPAILAVYNDCLCLYLLNVTGDKIKKCIVFKQEAISGIKVRKFLISYSVILYYAIFGEEDKVLKKRKYKIMFAEKPAAMENQKESIRRFLTYIKDKFECDIQPNNL